MTELAGYMSTALYAAGAGMFIAAGIVFKKNDLLEYYRLMKGLPLKGNSSPPTKGTVKQKKSRVLPGTEEEHATTRLSQETDDEATTVHKGNADTTVLRSTDLRTGDRENKPGRTWGRPSGKFRVVTSEVVVSDPDKKEGERK